jgi:hypothetical protein
VLFVHRGLTVRHLIGRCLGPLPSRDKHA